MNPRFLPIAIVCFLIAACVQVQSTKTSPVNYAPIRPEQVYVFQTEKEVPGTFTSVGMIFTQAGSGYQNEGAQIDAAKKRAAQMGANGIILGGFTEPGSGVKIASAIFGVPSFRKGRVLAIRFRRHSPSTSASPTPAATSTPTPTPASDNAAPQ